MGRRAGLDIEDQSPLLAAGQIGTPIAEYVSPDAEDYAEAVASGDMDKLSQPTSETDS